MHYIVSENMINIFISNKFHIFLKKIVKINSLMKEKILKLICYICKICFQFY